MPEVLECLKKYGQRLDLEIAEEIHASLAAVRRKLTELSKDGSIVMCSLTRYEGTKKIEAWQCRLSGYAPSPAPGRKAKGTSSRAADPSA